MPKILGKLTLGDKPCRVKISEWFIPNPLTLTKVHPSRNLGIGLSSNRSFSGPPGS